MIATSAHAAEERRASSRARRKLRPPEPAGAVSMSASSSTSRAVGRAGRRDHHVARPGRQVVGDVEAARAAQQRRHALLQQQPLDELRLGLVAPAGHAHEVALGELRLDLARALVAVGDRRLDARAPRRTPAACRSAGRSARRAGAWRRSDGQTSGSLIRSTSSSASAIAARPRSGRRERRAPRPRARRSRTARRDGRRG